jgi:phosphoribosylformylglycinamidine synthase
VVAPVGDALLNELPTGCAHLIHVLPKPGVMDPVAESALGAIADFGLRAEAVRTLKKYAVGPLSDQQISLLCSKVLANDAVEQVVVGPLCFERLQVGSPYEFQLKTVPILAMDDSALVRLSREGQLYLSLVEMQTIQAHFRGLERDPTDIELETTAQTWSEHCSHKTLAGRIRYRDENGERSFKNMLKETIFAATQQIRKQAGERDWCVSVFSDNAGVIHFDDQYNVCFKVETHNHPSALEPYGGANTGLGGVIRDPMGTGMGAKPICNTDVFCFAPPDTPVESLPPGVLHPRRVMKGVVSGVRDYGNRMGIPTVNGAVYFDPRYLGNPLVYCGNIGLIPCDQSFKHQQPNDLIVAIGGRTGRDGIHGATFSSAELTSHSETISGGAVQIGNAITEKMVLDVLLAARDRGLYNAVTDCGAGGFSSAVGEMGEKIGAEVWLERIPVKYEGLSYTEMWISEAQERMVFSVSPEKWDELKALCDSECVEATVIGQFVPHGRLILKYAGQQVADLAMEFLHDGRPPVVRDAVYTPPQAQGLQPLGFECDFTKSLLKILGSLNVCSKEWVIRQYDHEVQGGSVLKPLVGTANDGPGDAAVLRPVLTSRRGIVVSCGMNPCYGDFDTYWMAASAIDEAVRNCVAVGADPTRIAILDNFCWGTTDRPETLGSLVRAALACYDMATALGTPFISGKDSLNNEFRPLNAKEPISIPPSLLISALGQVDDVGRCVSMDLKESGNLLYLVGLTKDELGGSHYAMVEGLSGGEVPKVDVEMAKKTFLALHHAISSGLVRSCHDLSEGGLAVAAAEMAFAGGLGAKINLPSPSGRGAGGEGSSALSPSVLLFSESNTRFLCEVRPANAAAFKSAMAGIVHAQIGEVTDSGHLEILGETPLVQADIKTLKEAWQKPLRW